MRGRPGTRAAIGLGSNLGDSPALLSQALQSLDAHPDIRLAQCSRLYRSAPLGPADQPDYANAAAVLHTDLSPLALLDVLQAIEQDAGRERLLRWGPRTLDLDLLLYDEQVINEPRLQVPHPEMTQRAFVLTPLAELVPDWRLPDGRCIAELAARLPQDGLQPWPLPDWPASGNRHRHDAQA